MQGIMQIDPIPLIRIKFIPARILVYLVWTRLIIIFLTDRFYYFLASNSEKKGVGKRDFVWAWVSKTFDWKEADGINACRRPAGDNQKIRRLFFSKQLFAKIFTELSFTEYL